MSDVTPDDLTAVTHQLRNGWLPSSPDGRWTHAAADLIDALSADVARLTAELIEANFANEAHSAIKSTSIVLRHERDEALSRVAEHAATIEHLRNALDRHWRLDCHAPKDARAVLADTAPTPETPSKADRHMSHARNCWCLNDGAVCCDPSCCSEGSR